MNEIGNNSVLENVNIEVKASLRALVAIGIFICMLSNNFIGTAFGTALPKMLESLAVTQMNFIGLLFTLSILVTAVFTPMAANISKRIGRKKLFLIGSIINVISIILMYFSSTLFTMIASRGLQGFGSAFIFATGLSLIGDVFPASQRAKWLSGYGVITSVGSLGGPLIAGLLVDYYNWRSIFLIAILVGLIGTFMVSYSLPKDIVTNEDVKSKFDYLGSLTFGLSLAFILGVCITGGTFFQWMSVTTFLLIGVGLILLLAFIKIEKNSTSPILPLEMFKYNVFTICVICVCLNTIATMAVTTYLPYFIQAVMLKSATVSGSMVATLSLLSMILGPIIGQIVARTGKFKFMTILATVFVAVPSLVISTFSPTTTLLYAWVVIASIGINSGITQFIYTAAVQNGVPNNKISLATGGTQLGVVIGAMLGIAFTGIIMTSMPDLSISLPFMFRFSAIVAIIGGILLLFLKESHQEVLSK
ncbi:MFS transporter [Alkalibaculum sp. M08DMB]|uniref:MFS transporter n=1 Tax=Alkalibaculum sporogenes TaxID=2655001 RepID=A0A6A7KB91_9FIRM|nr:MFS transporter [Alkalibaculum sporogenes]MPW26551.1 MFS transporter [Alkalibaculum sporogenes]